MNDQISVDPVKTLGTIMGVWAHPDDESWLSAGLMVAALQNGQEVVCITATRGEAGLQNEAKWPKSTLGKVRSLELAKALSILGVKHHHWLDYPDTACSSVVKDEASSRIGDLIAYYKPDSILTFGAEGWTGNPDHCAVSEWVGLAVASSEPKPQVYHAVITPKCYKSYLKKADKKLNIFYKINEPPVTLPENCDICFELPMDLCKLKCEALAAMPSQCERMYELFPLEWWEGALSTEVFVLASTKAEVT